MSDGLGHASAEWRIHWILRVAIAAEFIGHGAFGIKGKDAWLAYYDVMMIPPGWAEYLMPLTGVVDITLGLLILFRPMRAAILYMAFWGLFTASLRPLAGEGVWEMVERSYNYGVPLILLLLVGPGVSVRHWFERVREVPRLTVERARSLAWGLRAIIAAYLVGHGALGVLTGKPLLLEHYDSIGLTAMVGDAGSFNDIVGLFEIVRYDGGSDWSWAYDGDDELPDTVLITATDDQGLSNQIAFSVRRDGAE